MAQTEAIEAAVFRAGLTSMAAAALKARTRGLAAAVLSSWRCKCIIVTGETAEV